MGGGSLGLTCLYLSTVTFLEQACDSQSTSTSIRSRPMAPQRSNLTPSLQTVFQRAWKVWCYFQAVFLADSPMCPSLICAHASLRPRRETRYCRAYDELCSWWKILNNLLGDPSILIAPVLIFSHCCKTLVIRHTSCLSQLHICCFLPWLPTCTSPDFRAAPQQLMLLISVQHFSSANPSAVS